MRLLQISDVHFTHFTYNPFRFCLKRLSGLANWLFFRRSEHAREPLMALPALINQLNVDVVLVGGDLTSTSLKSEFEDAQTFFNQISASKLYIPGNHDQYTRHSHRERRFYRYFQNKRTSINHPLDFFTLSEHGIEVHRFEPSIWCIALDTAPPTSLVSSNGLFSRTIESYLEEILLSIPKNDIIFILNHFPIFDNDETLHRLIHAERLRDILEKNPHIHLYLNGHTHRHCIADLRPNHLPLMIDSGCPIQKLKSTWNLIDLTLTGCKVQGYQWMGQAWDVFQEASFEWNHA